MPSRRIPADDRDEKIRKLEEDLWMIRYDLISMMPARLNSKLMDFHCVYSIEDLHDWAQWVVEEVLDAADQRPGHELGGTSEATRAFCPLCEFDPSSRNARGFAFPIGLTRHLEGTHKQVQCCVLRAGYSLALGRVRSIEAGEKQLMHRPEEVRPWNAPKPVPPAPPVPPLGPKASVLQFRNKSAPK